MKRWICLVGILISLILMLLPEGVAMTFASSFRRDNQMFLPFFQQDTVRLWKPVSRGFHPFERHRRGIFTFCP